MFGGVWVMKFEDFLSLPRVEVATIVRDKGVLTAAFPTNGTRRWFMLEHELPQDADWNSAYLETNIEEVVRLCSLFYDHGIQHFLTPIFGPALLRRGPEYLQLVYEGIISTANHPRFLQFYDEYDVRVIFYGDYRRTLAARGDDGLIASCDALMAKTASHTAHTLCFGIDAHDEPTAIAQIAVQFQQAHGRLPNRAEMIEAYYGVAIEPLSFFIGFEKFHIFDVPLLRTGLDSLYFTVAPSYYMNERQFREILFDHIYLREVEHVDYELTKQQEAHLAAYYRANKHVTMGVGDTSGAFPVWRVLPKITVPDENRS